MKKTVVVAIDGPAGAGKSTVARSVAAKLGYVYINTGAMYRAVTLWAVRLNADLDDSNKLTQLAQNAKIEFVPGATTVLLNGEDVSSAIVDPKISEAASKISAIAGVRRAMVDAQRKIAEGASVVMEGRDIGTVVFPDAAVKVYLDADVQVRAVRRTKELEQRGVPADLEEIAAQIAERDERDATRVESPMTQAADAVYVNSSGLTPDEVDGAILRIVRQRVSNGKEMGQQ